MTKIGIISFTDPRMNLQGENEFENDLKKNHLSLVEKLSKDNEVVNPHENLKADNDNTYGVRSTKELFTCIDKLRDEKVNGVVLGLWKWSDPYLCVRLVKELNVPAVLYTETDSSSSGTTFLAAVAASVDELNLEAKCTRMWDDENKILDWASTLTSDYAKQTRSDLLEDLHRSSIMLFGGSYCLRMDVLQDDIPKLKSLLIGDILQEDQYILIQKAEKILQQSKEVNEFKKFLEDNQANIKYGGKLIYEGTLRQQIALYLAAKERLGELEGENISGVSIKCQPEISEYYGVTACMLPAFLPFGADHIGEKKIMPTVCEGDIKGLLTSVILHKLNPSIPPLFGDLKTINDDYLIIANCGASSAYYAANSNNPKEAIKNLNIEGQCQGKAGAAIGYQGKAIDEITVARLIRINGEYALHLGVGKTLDVDDKIMDTIKWGKQWPHVAISLNTDKDRFMEIVGSNHYCMTSGNYSKELEALAKEVSIPVVRIDNLRGKK